MFGGSRVVTPVWWTAPSGHSVCPVLSFVAGPIFLSGVPAMIDATSAAVAGGAAGGLPPFRA